VHAWPDRASITAAAAVAAAAAGACAVCPYEQCQRGIAAGKHTWEFLTCNWRLLCSFFLQTKSYYLLLDMGREEMVLEWVRTLLQCIK
jgi:hypothetical protein